MSEEEYQKPDFQERQSGENLKSLFYVVMLLTALFGVVFPLFGAIAFMSPNQTYVDICAGAFFFLLFVCYTFVFRKLLLTSWHNFLAHRHRIFLLLALGHTLLSLTFLLMASSVLVFALDDRSGTVTSSKSLCCSYQLMCLLSILLIMSAEAGFKHRCPLRVFPAVIASAEMETDEYMNGYSQRPVDARFQEYDQDTMRRFAGFLLKYVLIWNIKEEERSFTLQFPPLQTFRAIMKMSQSHIKIYNDGRAEVFITPEEYDFMKVPISYHLLCEKVIEKMGESYAQFAKGDESAALRVFDMGKGGGK